MTGKISRIWSLGAAFFSMMFSFQALAWQGGLKAGASMVDITPPLGLGVVGNFIIPPATHIHDALHARALVLDDGTNKLVFVIADNVGIDQGLLEQAKSRVKTETGIPVSNILMAATHTHSATSAGGDGERRGSLSKETDAYQQFLVSRLADAVRIAVNNLEPARLGWSSGSVPQHVFNRRWKMKEKVRSPFGDFDQVQFNPGIGNANKIEPAGETDPEVSFFSVQSLDGRAIALLANYSLHYVGGVPAGHISADYFALFSDKIKQALAKSEGAPPFVAMMTNGTSGDVNNINFKGPAGAFKPYEKMNIVAEDVAREVLRAYQSIRYKTDVSLKAARTDLSLEVRKPSKSLYERSLKIRDMPEGTKFEHGLERAFAERAIQLYEQWPDKIEVPLQVFRIGDLGIAAIPFEVFTETGLDIKKRAPFAQNFTISFANGSYSYLATPAQHRLGGYETWITITKVEEKASEKVTDTILNLFNQVK